MMERKRERERVEYWMHYTIIDNIREKKRILMSVIDNHSLSLSTTKK